MTSRSSQPTPKPPRAPTAFEERVYAACRRIPAGGVTSYAALARAVDCGSAQAVGQALRRNPFAPQVPCHRVVCADGRLGGFSGQRQGPELERKQALLRAEGVKFDEYGRVLPSCFRPGPSP